MKRTEDLIRSDMDSYCSWSWGDCPHLRWPGDELTCRRDGHFIHCAKGNSKIEGALKKLNKKCPLPDPNEIICKL